jgi:hypothetical protein
MAEILFYANIGDSTPEETRIEHESGEGLGFYGLGFGQSVAVGSVQNTTFVTNSTGTIEGARCNNTAMIEEGDTNTSGTVSVNGSTDYINLENLPNYLCPLRINFNHTEAVRVENCKLRIFKPSANVDTPAEEVTTYVYEARHPSTLTSAPNLSWKARNYNSWVAFNSEATGYDGQTVSPFELTLTPSPGTNGLNSDGADDAGAEGSDTLTTDADQHVSTQHDWYLALSAMPQTIGTKADYGLYVTLEYLS